MGFVNTATTQVMIAQFTDFGKWALTTHGFSNTIKSFGLADNDVDYRRFSTVGSSPHTPQTYDTTYANCPTTYPCSGQTIQTAPGGQGVLRLSGCCFYNYPLERGSTYTLGEIIGTQMAGTNYSRLPSETVCKLAVFKGCRMSERGATIADQQYCPDESYSTLHWNYTGDPRTLGCFDTGYDVTALGPTIACDCMDAHLTGPGGVVSQIGVWNAHDLWSVALSQMIWPGTPYGNGYWGDFNGDGITDCVDLEYAFCCLCHHNGHLDGTIYDPILFASWMQLVACQGNWTPQIDCIVDYGFSSNCDFVMPAPTPSMQNNNNLLGGGGDTHTPGIGGTPGQYGTGTY